MPPPARPGALRVLLVDDNRDAADSMAILLEMSGHAVTIAYDGMEAVHVAARVRPDVALVDLAMPGMDGFAVVHALRQMPALANTRYIAMTGFGQASDRQQTQEGPASTGIWSSRWSWKRCSRPSTPASIAGLIPLLHARRRQALVRLREAAGPAQPHRAGHGPGHGFHLRAARPHRHRVRGATSRRACNSP